MKIRKVVKLIYQIVPFKHTIFSILKFFWRPPQSVYKFLTFNGVLKVKTLAGTQFKIRNYGEIIENEIFWSSMKNWEIVSLGIWSKLCKDADVIFDAGANTGIYSLIAKSINPNAEVYAFEPVERVYEKLVINNNLNKFNISCNNIALSNYEGEATLYDLPGQHVYTAFVNKNYFEGVRDAVAVKIKATTLDKFIQLHNITKIDIIKIDVELHEVEVMEGFSNYLSQYKPTILIEILNDEIDEKIQHIVKELDYIFFNIDERKGIKRVETIGKSDYYNYLLCSKEVVEKYKLVETFSDLSFLK